MIPRSIAVKTLGLRIDVEKSSYHHLSQDEMLRRERITFCLQGTRSVPFKSSVEIHRRSSA